MRIRALSLFGFLIFWIPYSCFAADLLTELEKGIGMMVASGLEEQFSLSGEATFNARANNIGLQLIQTKYAKRKGIDYQFRVLDTSEINAFAIPGGFVYTTTGLIEAFGPSDDEMAFVLSHEIAHVKERHGLQKLGTGLVLGALLGDTKSTALNIIQQLLVSGRSRQDEREADEKGAQLALEAGYDPAGGLAAMRRLETLHEKTPDPLTRLFATHPPTQERSETIKGFLFESATGSDYKTLTGGLLPETNSFIQPTDTFVPSPKSQFGSEWVKKCDCGVWMKHCGVDVDHNQSNKEIKCAGDGVVRYANSFGKGWGSCVIVEHNLTGVGPISTLYGHIVIAPGIKPGTLVSQGQLLGTIDPKIKPPHLHFGVRLASYEPNLSIKGALHACEKPKHTPKFPEKFTDPIQFLKEHQPRAPVESQPGRAEILLERGPQHLGDDTPDSRVIWFKEFELTETDLADRHQAAIRLRVKGTPRKDPVISFNRQKVGYAVTRSGEWEDFQFNFDPEILRCGKNLIDLETLIPNLRETFDDCEFAEVYLFLE